MKIFSFSSVLLLIVYLVSDFFLSGYQAAMVLLVVGISHFVLNLIKKRKDLSLLAETTVFAVASASGSLIGSAGIKNAGILCLETIIFLVLLVSLVMGWPVLGVVFRKSIGLKPGKNLIKRMTGMITGILGMHLIVIAAAAIFFRIDGMLFLAVSFLIIYFTALIFFRKKQKSEAKKNVAVAKRVCPEENSEMDVEDVTEENIFNVIIHREDSVIGKCFMTESKVADIRNLEINDPILTGEILGAIEGLCIEEGIRTLRFKNWKSDKEILKIRGYLNISDCWQRILPVYGRRKK
jgi:hypothetical protein